MGPRKKASRLRRYSRRQRQSFPGRQSYRTLYSSCRRCPSLSQTPLEQRHQSATTLRPSRSATVSGQMTEGGECCCLCIDSRFIPSHCPFATCQTYPLNFDECILGFRAGARRKRVTVHLQDEGGRDFDTFVVSRGKVVLPHFEQLVLDDPQRTRGWSRRERAPCRSRQVANFIGFQRQEGIGQAVVGHTEAR